MFSGGLCTSSAIDGLTTLVSAVDYRGRGCMSAVVRSSDMYGSSGVVIRYPNGSVIFVVMWIQVIFIMDGCTAGLFVSVRNWKWTGDS